VGRRNKGRSGEAADKAVGRVVEAAGSLTGDETLQAEGRALGREGRRKTYRVVAQPEGGWVVESGEVGQISSVHRIKDEAVASARVLARAHKPSQVLVYKQDGTVQSEHTYG
jgi:uncharacterized protein YjbJ (UPF0337 family)